MTTRKPQLTDYICDACRKATQEKRTHPGQMHKPGLCDCRCRDQ